MNDSLLVPVLLAVLALTLGAGAALVRFVLSHPRRAITVTDYVLDLPLVEPRSSRPNREYPTCWLAIKNRHVPAIQSALRLRNPRPCSWSEGVSSADDFVIWPTAKGWTLIFGAGLPDPASDVDACFKFLLRMSQRLGQVQYFSASRALNYHAWAKVQSGKVVRAYAWAGKTLWIEGRPTAAESELGVKCFDYAETPFSPLAGTPDSILANVEKVPQLAARWSLDPGSLEERALESQRGLAGNSTLKLV